MGFCLDLFTIIISFGAVLYIFLGVFSLLGFEVLESHANKWKNDSTFAKQTTKLAIVFWVPGLIYIFLLSFLIYYSYMKKPKSQNAIPYLLNPEQSKKDCGPTEMTKHSEEEIISTDLNKRNEDMIEERGSINV